MRAALSSLGHGLLASGLELLFPWRCLLCRDSTAQRAPNALGSWICAPCDRSIGRLGPDVCVRCATPRGPYLGALRGCPNCRKQRFIRRTHAVFRYSDAGRALIHQLKYQGQTELAESFAALLSEVIASRAPDCIVPVPMHWSRRLSRGFNQSLELARALGARLERPVVQALQRRRRTRPLFSLSRAERQELLADAFQCRGKALAGRSVLLVDDVRTSGTTLTECARALKAAGSRSIEAAVVAIVAPAHLKSRVGSS